MTLGDIWDAWNCMYNFVWVFLRRKCLALLRVSKMLVTPSLHKWSHLKWPHYGVYISQFFIWSLFINKYRISDCLKRAKKYLTKQSYSVTLVMKKITLKRQLTMQGYELWLPIKWHGWWRFSHLSHVWFLKPHGL